LLIKSFGRDMMFRRTQCLVIILIEGCSNKKVVNNVDMSSLRES